MQYEDSFPPDFLSYMCSKIVGDGPSCIERVVSNHGFLVDFVQAWTHSETSCSAWTRLCGAVVLAIYNAPSSSNLKSYEKVLLSTLGIHPADPGEQEQNKGDWPSREAGGEACFGGDTSYDYVCRYLGPPPALTALSDWGESNPSTQPALGAIHESTKSPEVSEYIGAHLVAGVAELLRSWPTPFPCSSSPTTGCWDKLGRVGMGRMLDTFSHGTMLISDRSCRIPGLGTFSLKRLQSQGVEYVHELIGVYLLLGMDDDRMFDFVRSVMRSDFVGTSHAQPQNIRRSVMQFRVFVTCHGVHMPWLPAQAW